ncbi:hypothetical protein MHU86_24734 [Fragilaria crotonensis]|nr:hypothetical protein MHU86_24734 [Fragilaria crotonensis]
MPSPTPELADIIRNIPTFATALRLFPNRSNFRDVPRFIIKFFQDQQLTPSPYDTTLDSTRTSHIQTPAHLDSASLIAFTHSPLVNGFGEPTTGISPSASHVARVLISATLRQHATLTAKLTTGDDLHLQPSNICIGSLPPVDLLMNHNCSAFPMATLPTPEQLSIMDSKATAIAVNFVICRPLTSNDLQNFTIPIGNFLIYQGNTQEHQSTPSYTPGSPTELPIPLPSAHTFPIIYNKENKPIIFHQHNGTIKPYTTTTVQQLFNDQACIPMNTCYAANPWTCPNNPSQLWRQPNPVYHVIDDPKTIPLSLATRLIQVITTKRGSTDVYGSWALPHLENALSNPLSQITHNPFSYYWQQHNHPEYPFIKDSEPNILSNPCKGQTCKHPTFAYPPIHETFFTDDEDNEDQQDDPPQIPLQSPDALTSSTRTDFTYPPIEDLTKTLLKYAKNANLRKLSYPTDLVARRRQFNAFMDNLRIVCNISPWTRQVFDLWPKQISYSHPFIGTAIYNLIFTHVCDPCQKHIIDGPPDARTAIFTLRRHCAPLTPDHVEHKRSLLFNQTRPQ